MTFFQYKMEQSLVFLLYYQDISSQLQENNQYLDHLMYLISLYFHSFKDLNDHATFQFHHKVEIHSEPNL